MGIPSMRNSAIHRRVQAQILQEADGCTKAGEVGALLRREGLYSSHLTTWRALRERGELAGLTPKKRGPKAREVDERDLRIVELERQLARAEAKIERAELIIDVQENHPRAGSYLLNQKLQLRYRGRGPGGAAVSFLETTTIP